MIQVPAIGQDHIGHDARVAVVPMLADCHDLPEGKL
jgi:hypothetical protein